MSECDPFRKLESLLADDPGKRGVVGLVQPGDLAAACGALRRAERIVIVTGFFIPSANACETDGPLGAAALADVLVAQGKSVAVLTDDRCLPVVKSATKWASRDASLSADADALVAVERLGRAADGRYYTMRGVDATAWTAPLDELFLPNARGGVTIGVGDGGNEVGMGKVRDAVVRDVPQGERIGSVIATDYLVAGGVSNWGAWGLAAGLCAGKLDRFSTPDSAFAVLQRMVAAGAVDGVTGRNECTVDGLPWAVHAAKLAEIRHWIGAFPNSAVVA